MAMVVLALAVVLVGALLVWWAVRSRERRGLGSGETVALDDVTLFSERLRLVGRPDRTSSRGFAPGNLPTDTSPRGGTLG